MKPINTLRKAFPNTNIQELGSKPNAYGCNLYFDNLCVTVYWAKKRYGVGTKWGYYKTLNELVETINTLVNPPKKVAPVAKKGYPYLANEAAAMYAAQHGVQSCITHIQKKRELILKHQPDNKLAAFCMTLIDELQQFL